MKIVTLALTKREFIVLPVGLNPINLACSQRFHCITLSTIFFLRFYSGIAFYVDCFTRDDKYSRIYMRGAIAIYIH